MIAKAIWSERRNIKDEYLDFTGSFKTVKGEKVTLRVSAGEMFAAYCNGELCAFGACMNFPGDKEALVFDISSYCDRENSLKITVWHTGDDTNTCIADAAYLAFTVESGKKTLLSSDGSILQAKNLHYRNGYCKRITPQLGYSFYYDNSIFLDAGQAQPATVYETLTYRERPLPPLKLGARCPMSLSETEDGFLIDLGRECVGFLELDLIAEGEEELCISYGEHLREGRVPRHIGTRDFSVEIRTRTGRNFYTNPFRRIAGRYLFVNSKRVQISYLGIRSVEFPILTNKVKFENKDLQKIYDTSVYTLKCCMHEHYEDCPWREQALYALDSRNQMLCGYYAFRGHKFQRENLKLLAASQLEDGLLNICAPSGVVLPIPSFSLIYPVQVAEYIAYTGDESLLAEVELTLRRLMRRFSEAIDETGLIPRLPAPAWNFYEWSEGSDGQTPGSERCYDLLLNLFYLHAVRHTDRLFGERTDTVAMRAAIRKTFYDGERGLYRLSSEGEPIYSVLGNAVAILVGLGDRAIAERILSDSTLVPITLSMNTFLYDALLSLGGYEEEILSDILKKYMPMLDAGATTFWETERGAEDFDGAGSLCHGWSALPVYYLSVLREYKKKKGETL